MLEHQRLRAGYDFLLLRCASGEIDAEIGEWWTGFINGDAEQREKLINTKPKASGAPAAKNVSRADVRQIRQKPKND